ncbi:MAG: phosphatase PAP2 family protein [Burkholderiales bacterium]|nr:phosphatase PAP2 family protein [Burkholderiales bacterium]
MNLSWVAVALVLAGGCAAVTPAPPTELPEVRPGYVAGYLEQNELPDSRALLPPPPAAKSAALAADEEAYRATRALRTTPRWELAAKDAELRFPRATEHFSCALGIPVSAEATPHLNMLLRRVRMDSSRSADRAKALYKRMRPFMVANDPICTPREASRFKADSYPSGHSSVGWAWALVLAEAEPDRADALFARGLAFGQSRVVCGVHWKSDVEAGRVMGAATVSRLHANPVFNAQLAEARKEIAAARAAGKKPALDCAAEARALALDR